jgi:DHA1 family tetracycline resistance protein-like MFS transporter
LTALSRYSLVLNLSAVIVLAGLAQNSLQSIWVLYTDYRFDWGPREVGFSLAVVGLAAVIVQGGLTGPIVARLGEPRAIVFGLSISALSYFLYGFAGEAWMFYVIPFFSALGFVSGPSAQALISRTVGANEQGAVQGALASLTSLTGVVGPLLATGVFRYFIGDRAPFTLPGAPFLLGALFLVGALIVAVRTFAHPPMVESGTG